MTNTHERKPETIIFVAAFSAFLATFNETFLNVAFSPIMADFGVRISTVQWLAAAYMLGAAVMVPVSAFLYRSIPTKPLYLVTVDLLIVGSVTGALAPNFGVLLAGRIIQALGTGMLIPIGMNITLEVAPKRKLGTYMGIMGAMTTLGPSSSVIAAGLLLNFFPWQTLLWVFAGLSALCFLCGLFLLDNVANLTHPKLDSVSPVLIGLALIGILYGISTVFSGNIKLAVIAAAVGVVFLVLFIRRQKKLPEPLIDLRPLSVKPFATGVVINMLSLIVIFAMNIVMPLFMQNVLGRSALSASLTLFPAILLSCVVAPIAGRVYDRHGARVLLPLGFALICAFTFALTFGKDTGSLIVLAVLYIPVICGSALIIGPVQSLALSYLTHELNPHGVTVMSTGFQIAGCIGSSLFTGVYSMGAAAGQPETGFTSAGVLAAVLALAGLVLAIVISREAQKIPASKPASGPLETTGIAAVMKRDVFSVSVHATLLDALKCMTEKKTGGLPVLADDGHVAGFISDGDIVRFMLDTDTDNANFASMYPLWHDTKALDEQLEGLDKYNVMELANRKVIAVDIADDVRGLFKILSDKKIKKVPVLENGKIVGTASRSDLLRKLVAQSPVVQG
ncbi:MAG: MFS transporter [Lentihominibacter sp.]|nr:MFS transporter [Lentihominibacter sp.]